MVPQRASLTPKPSQKVERQSTKGLQKDRDFTEEVEKMLKDKYKTDQINLNMLNKSENRFDANAGNELGNSLFEE